MEMYRLILGTKPDLSAEKRKKVLASIKDLIADVGGKIEDTKSGGITKLAYPIEEFSEANFSTIFFSAPNGKVGPLHKKILKISGILRAMVIRGEGVKGNVSIDQ
jgi:ribosomal protein S6